MTELMKRYEAETGEKAIDEYTEYANDGYVRWLESQLTWRPVREKPEKDGMCTWSEDKDCVWMTSCHASHIFFDGTPIENGYKFCPYCGKVLKEVEFEYEEEDV